MPPAQNRRRQRVGSASLGFEPEWHTVVPAVRQERCPSCGIRVERRVRRGARMSRQHVHHDSRTLTTTSATKLPAVAAVAGEVAEVAASQGVGFVYRIPDREGPCAPCVILIFIGYLNSEL